jgi:hypothetical protein
MIPRKGGEPMGENRDLIWEENVSSDDLIGRKKEKE